MFCHRLKVNISLNFSYVTLLARVYMWYLWPWHFHALERLHSSHLCGRCLYICHTVYIPGAAKRTHIHWPWMNHRWPSVIPEVKPALDFFEVTFCAMSLLHHLRGTHILHEEQWLGQDAHKSGKRWREHYNCALNDNFKPHAKW